MCLVAHDRYGYAQRLAASPNPDEQRAAERYRRLARREEIKFHTDVRRMFADHAVGLRQRRTAEAVLHLAEIEEQQFGVDFGVDQKLRGQRLAHVADRRKRCDDQRQR